MQITDGNVDDFYVSKNKKSHDQFQMFQRWKRVSEEVYISPFLTMDIDNLQHMTRIIQRVIPSLERLTEHEVDLCVVGKGSPTFDELLD